MASAASLEKRYKRCVQNLDFYGAEQACRMLHHRLTTSKTATAEDKQKALKSLFEGSVWLLAQHQAQAGSALGLLAVKHCVDEKVPVTSDSVNSLIEISNAFVIDPSSPTVNEVHRERLRFLKAAIAWSSRADTSGTKYGDPTLNTHAALMSAALGEHVRAQKFFVRSDSPVEFAKSLYEWSEKSALPNEKGLIIARATLLYLASENIKDAKTLVDEFFKLSGWTPALITTSQGSPNAPVPLGNFCCLLVKICELEAKAAPLFEKMRATYGPELKRDPELDALLGIVGTKYFKIKQAQPGGISGMMSSMLRGFMTGSASSS